MWAFASLVTWAGHMGCRSLDPRHRERRACACVRALRTNRPQAPRDASNARSLRTHPRLLLLGFARSDQKLSVKCPAAIKASIPTRWRRTSRAPLSSSPCGPARSGRRSQCPRLPCASLSGAADNAGSGERRRAGKVRPTLSAPSLPPIPTTPSCWKRAEHGAICARKRRSWWAPALQVGRRGTWRGLT